MTLLADVRYACRTLRKASLFTTLTLLSVGLGIGANGGTSASARIRARRHRSRSWGSSEPPTT